MSDPNRMGAVWCEDHQRWECSKRSKRSQRRCHAVALRGTATCFSHAGKRREVAKAQGEAVTAWSALSGTPAVSTTDAVLGMLHMSWLRVHLYARLLEQQVGDAQTDGSGRGDPFGEGAPGVGVGAGLVGQTFSGVKDIGIFATGEAIRGLTQLEAQERDRCVRFAKTAHDMGIAEQQIAIAEQQGALIAAAMLRVLDALDLTAEQQARAVDVMPRELRALEGGTA